MGAGVRKPDWELCLARELAREEPFKWGERDCCLFAADCVKAMTGDDPAKAWRGIYASEDEATALTGGNIASVISDALAVEIPPGYAQRGDVVLIPTRQGDMAAVIGLDGKAVMLLEQGYRRLPASLATKAWRV